MTTLAYPNSVGLVTRGYDDAGRLSSVTDWNSHQTVFNFDADSFLTSQVYPNGTTATYTPDGADQLTAISHAPTATPGSPFASFAYTRDDNGQLDSVISTGVPSDNHSYGYNTLNQLTDVDTASHTFDAGDNLTAFPTGATQSFNEANQLCWTAASGTGACGSPPTGATTYSYDARGNRTQMTPASGPSLTLGYDQANRLTSYGATAAYAYNGDGLRMSKTVSSTTTNFVWDVADGLPLLLTDGTTNYVYGPGGLPLEQITSTGATSYYHHDQLGSTRALTDSSGAVTSTYTYDAYGRLAASTGSVSNPFGYAGQYTDPETGLQYLRARYYDPATGQFLTRDPVLPTTRDAYGYASRSPLNYSDPSGLYSADSAEHYVNAGYTMVNAPWCEGGFGFINPDFSNFRQLLPQDLAAYEYMNYENLVAAGEIPASARVDDAITQLGEDPVGFLERAAPAVAGCVAGLAAAHAWAAPLFLSEAALGATIFCVGAAGVVSAGGDVP